MGLRSILKKKPTVGFWAGDENNFQFVDELIEVLSKKYHTKKFQFDGNLDQLKNDLKSVDVAWFEWGNGPVVPATQFDDVSTPIINRIHRYELYSESPKHIVWERVNKLVFTSPSMIIRFEKQFPDENKRVNKEFVPIGVDVEHFQFHDKPISKELLYVGRIHPHKDPSVMLQIMAKLVQIDVEYKLKVVGSFHDELYKEYFYDQIEKLGLNNNVDYCGQVPHEKVYDYMQNADQILITSIIEGLSQATLEAMACGVRPVIFDYFGSEFAYPRNCIYRTVEEAVELIRNPKVTRAECRRLIESDYNLEFSEKRITEIIDKALI